jgi:hypothetical protein
MPSRGRMPPASPDCSYSTESSEEPLTGKSPPGSLIIGPLTSRRPVAARGALPSERLVCTLWGGRLALAFLFFAGRKRDFVGAGPWHQFLHIRDGL